MRRHHQSNQPRSGRRRTLVILYFECPTMLSAIYYYARKQTQAEESNESEESEAEGEESSAKPAQPKKSKKCAARI